MMRKKNHIKYYMSVSTCVVIKILCIAKSLSMHRAMHDHNRSTPALHISYRMSSLPVSSFELCLLNFLEETAQVSDWYMLGLYMGVPREDLSHIEKQFSGHGSARCRAELFNVWMKRTPNASWELIAAALEKLGETVLAEKVRKRCSVLPAASDTLEFKIKNSCTL